MKKAGAFFIVILVIAAIFIFEPFRTEPPAPRITVDDKVIPATHGSYCWNGLLFARCADFIYSTPFEMTEDHTPTKVRAKEEIEIDFKKEPDSRTVEVWTSETKSETVRLENGSFAAPEEKGSMSAISSRGGNKGTAIMLFRLK